MAGSIATLRGTRARRRGRARDDPPQDYLARYGETDKTGSGLDRADGWPVPYWHTDAAMATMALLLLVEESGLAGDDVGQLSPR